MFTGVQTAFLDEEGRLNLPRSVSNGLDKEYRDRQLFVTSLDGESVKVFPLREWEVVEARLSDPSPEGNEPDGVLKDKILFQANRFGAEETLGYFVDLDSDPTGVVSQTRYWFGLFSHRRGGLWKGMLELSLAVSADDTDALALVTP